MAYPPLRQHFKRVTCEGSHHHPSRTHQMYLGKMVTLGICPVCKRSRIKLMKNGTLHIHLREDHTGWEPVESRP